MQKLPNGICVHRNTVSSYFKIAIEVLTFTLEESFQPRNWNDDWTENAHYFQMGTETTFIFSKVFMQLSQTF